MPKIKVVVPLGQVPDGETVTKERGTKRYTVRSQIPFYSDKGAKTFVKCEEGCRFLIPENIFNNPDAGISAVPNSMAVVWEATIKSLTPPEEEEN